MAGPAKALSVDVLWQIARVGAVDLAPDGRHAVCTLTEQDPQGSAVTSLWLLPTDRCAPRRLSWCGQRDGQPAFSPQGDRIAFVARREQQGHKDATPKEARRAGSATSRQASSLSNGCPTAGASSSRPGSGPG
jgi:dipeptidyl aminopeptidase/acylaminoacyl peptidase